jgi:hypothetical protein
MWCRPPRHLSSALLPFMEGEVLPNGPAPLCGEGDQPSDWSKIMGLAPVRNPNVRDVVLDGETVLFDLVTGRSFRLDALAAAVWEHCTGTATLQQIHQTVSVRLKLPLVGAHEQMVARVVQWSHDGLLHQSDAARGSI